MSTLRRRRGRGSRHNWPPDFQVTFTFEDGEALEEERRKVSQLSDEELLAAIARACGEIVLIGDPARLQVQLPDDAWELEQLEIVPADPNLQAFLLWHLATESLGIATFALERRAATTALAQVRLICDAYCLLRWLKEPEMEAARKARTIGLVLSEIEDEKRVVGALGTTPEREVERRDQVEHLTELQAALEEAARADGVEPERPPAAAKALYDQYFPPGYRVFRLLSDLGSHVGLRFLGEFFRESGSSSTHQFDFERGGLRQRCFWLAAAYVSFAGVAEVIAWYFEWEEGMRPEILNHYRSSLGLLAEAQRRYDAFWLARP